MQGLALCGATVSQASFAERVELAAEAGFDFVSMFATDYAMIRADGWSADDVRAHLRAHSISIAELDALFGWLPGSTAPPMPMGASYGEADFFAVADDLGAHCLNVVDLCAGPTPPIDAAAEAFACVCDRAAEHGLLVSIEFVPWTRIPDIGTAWKIVNAADRANGGVMLDNWHLFRSGGTLVDVAAMPAERIVALQISDAPESERNARSYQAEQHRLLPGHGATGVRELLQLLEDNGCVAPLGVEVNSVELRALPSREATARAASAIGEVLSEMRNEP